MLRRVLNAIRSHPKLCAGGIVVAAAALLIGGTCLYARQQWRSAERALNEGRYPDAQQGFKRCLRFWPNDVHAHVMAARSFRLTGDFVDAEKYLNECLKLQRGASDEVQIEFLLMRVQRGEVDQLTETLMHLVDQQHPQSATILDTCASAYLFNHRYRPALKCIERWVTIDPAAARPHQLRGWVYEEMNLRVDAMKEYKQALQLDPSLVPVRLRLAEMLINEKQPLEALPHLQILRQQFPDRADVMARLGQCRYLQGQNEEARRLMTAAVEKMPDDSQLLLHLGKLENEADHPVEAEKWLRRAHKADPSDPESLYVLVPCLRRQGREQDAENTLKEYQNTKKTLEQVNQILRDQVNSPITDPEKAYQAGAGLLELGQSRLGLYWLHQALIRDPNHQPTHRLLMEYYEKQNDPEQAAIHRARLRDAAGTRSTGSAPVGN